MNELKLIPTHWASVSGGKDSLYMMDVIFNNLGKYPLDGVVHFELEIDYPFIKDVVSRIKTMCELLQIPFFSVKPERTWEEIYYSKLSTGKIYGFPTRKARWCNSIYKLSAKRKMIDYMKTLGKDVYFYIGYCADEKERMKNRSFHEIYPLAENNIDEDLILEWARENPIFNNYYKTNRRCGCMYCPLMSRIQMAYLLKYYPDKFDYMIDKIRETEKIRTEELNRPFSVIDKNPKYNADYLNNIIRSKWLEKLNKIERG